MSSLNKGSIFDQRDYDQTLSKGSIWSKGLWPVFEQREYLIKGIMTIFWTKGIFDQRNYYQFLAKGWQSVLEQKGYDLSLNKGTTTTGLWSKRCLLVLEQRGGNWSSKKRVTSSLWTKVLQPAWRWTLQPALEHRNFTSLSTKELQTNPWTKGFCNKSLNKGIATILSKELTTCLWTRFYNQSLNKGVIASL